MMHTPNLRGGQVFLAKVCLVATQALELAFRGTFLSTHALSGKQEFSAPVISWIPGQARNDNQSAVCVGARGRKRRSHQRWVEHLFLFPGIQRIGFVPFVLLLASCLPAGRSAPRTPGTRGLPSRQFCAIAGTHTLALWCGAHLAATADRYRRGCPCHRHCLVYHGLS
jgi:hypothetical protein